MSSKSLNRVLLIGNVTRDPELRYTPQGNAVVSFGLATNRSWKTETGEIKEEAEFHRLVAWNKLAEICAQFCLKGRKIYVEGRLQTRTWTGTADNLQHTVTEIVIDDMILLGSPMGAGAPVSAGQPTVASAPVAPTPAPVVDESEKDEKPHSAPISPRLHGASRGKEKVKEEVEVKEEAKVETKETPKEDVNVDDIPF